MDDKIIYAGLNDPVAYDDIISEFCTDKTVLDLGCVNHNWRKQDRDGWMHEKLRKASA